MVLVGVVFAGAVQDMTVLFFSTRRDGKSLADMVRSEMGPIAGAIAGVGVLLICVIVLAVLALVVVKALAGSPWGAFTVFCTLPIALLMGSTRADPPGRIGEMSAIGAVFLFDRARSRPVRVQSPALAGFFDLSGPTLAVILIGYGFVASARPARPLVGARDHLSTFLKIGTIILLAIGVIVVRPDLQMPALTKFVDGSGPVWAGGLFPFLFITIACGSVSGWHALIASGTTPKMIENENQIAFIGYGGMLMELFVAIMAMVGASVLHPGVYFAMNSSAGVIGATADQAAQVISSWGFTVTPDMLTQIAQSVGEKTILSRTGGAPTLAVGMASILSSFLGGGAMMGVWYHFIILFEALFILTTVDADARAALHDPAFCRRRDLGVPRRPTRGTTTSSARRWPACCGATCSTPASSIPTAASGRCGRCSRCNQMLAAIALTLCTVILFKIKRERFALVTIVQGLAADLHGDRGTRKGLPSQSRHRFPQPRGQFSAVAPRNYPRARQDARPMSRVVFNHYLYAGLAALSVAIVLAGVVYAIVDIAKALGSPTSTAVEVGRRRRRRRRR